jgi:hypothetical protein
MDLGGWLQSLDLDDQTTKQASVSSTCHACGKRQLGPSVARLRRGCHKKTPGHLPCLGSAVSRYSTKLRLLDRAAGGCRGMGLPLLPA